MSLHHLGSLTLFETGSHTDQAGLELYIDEDVLELLSLLLLPP